MDIRILWVAVLGITLTACQNQDYRYSCDDTVNSQVIENLEEIQGLTRAEWLKLDANEYRMAAFRAFTADQRHQFLTDKIDESLSFDWTPLERGHIVKLQQFIDNNLALLNSGWERNEDLRDKYDIFQYKWIEYAKETLQWDDALILAVAFSGDKMKSKTGELDIPAPKTRADVPQINNPEDEPPIGGDGPSGKPCSCWVGYSNCPLGDPMTWAPICTAGNCKKTSTGCQILMLGPCNGSCTIF